jgi:hypothetical protein
VHKYGKNLSGYKKVVEYDNYISSLLNFDTLVRMQANLPGQRIAFLPYNVLQPDLHSAPSGSFLF